MQSDMTWLPSAFCVTSISPDFRLTIQTKFGKIKLLFLRLRGGLMRSLKHGFGAAVFIVVLAALAWYVLDVRFLLPLQAAEQAKSIDWLFNFQFKLMAVMFGLIGGLLLYSVVFFRRKKGDETDGPHITGNTPLEIAWTAIPFAMVIGLALLGAQNLSQTQRIDPRALEVKVTGMQWAWKFEYPAYGIVTNELILPVNQQVVFKLTANDVIHSFWVPEWRVKQDAVPGKQETLRVTPDKTGEFQLVCAEICGAQHANMVSVVKVISQDDFKAWVAQQMTGETAANPADRGAQAFKTNGCAACHSLDGSKLVGPTFQGLYGREETLDDGSKIMVDDAYLLESIRQPAKKVVQGYPAVMQPFGADVISDETVADIIEYIKTLK
jgi:cytochrome c oxidase subunit 2